MKPLAGKTVLILGAGYSGKIIGQRCVQAGAKVFGTTRDAARFGTLEQAGLKPLLFDGSTLSEELEQALEETTHLVVSIAPPRAENTDDPDAIVDPVLRTLADHEFSEITPNLSWIGYLSTVGVYGDHGGAWVDEETPAAPVSARSRQRVRAEAEWLAIGQAISVPVGVFRLSGIYGPGRNALKTARDGKARRLVKPGQVFNRIHVDDIAAALQGAIERDAGGIFNITDDEPAPPQDVVTFAHDLLGLEPPPEMDFATAELTPMARSFYGENKRISNTKSKQALGLRYAHPNYRVALRKMHDEQNWM